MSKTVSQLTTSDIADYLRLPEVTPEDSAFIGNILEASKAFVYKYTGLTPAQVDEA